MTAVVSKQFRDLLGALNDASWELLGSLDELLAGVDPETQPHLELALTNPTLRMNGYVVLPPAGRRVPVVHVRHGPEYEGREMVRITLVLLGHDAEHKTYGTAWRFESPEGRGAHCYYHCQPVREVRGPKAIAALQRLPGWFPDDTPAIPVNATDADQLLISMLVAVYGHDSFDVLQQEYFNGQLSDRLKELDAS